MTVYQFLASLPALLGVAGFTVYLLLRRSQKGDAITARIVEKIRQQEPEQGLAIPANPSPAALAKIIEARSKLKEKIDRNDFLLLRELVRNQHRQAVLVYSLCAVLFVVGVAAFMALQWMPKPLLVDSIRLENPNPQAGGILLDLDSLTVHWRASGEPEDVEAVLENMDTGATTEPVRVSSAEEKAVIPAERFRPILANRVPKGSNPIRAAIRGKKAAFRSAVAELAVGTKLSVVGFPEKISILPRIDNQALPFTKIEAKVVLWQKGNPESSSIGGTIEPETTDFPLAHSELVEWDRLKAVYFGPDDPRLVRIELLGLAEAAQARN